MFSELRPQTTFTPFPIKERSTMEVLDVSVKLYRRYFGVLTLWSLIIAFSYLVNAFVGFATILTLPLMYGAVSCVLAAAVRGQSISFAQVWEFTKPRYGALIGMILLACIIIFVGVLALLIAGAALFFWVAALVRGAPTSIIMIVIVSSVVLGLTIFSVLSVVTFGWLNMVPVVVCMESANRGISPLGRSWNLIKGHWTRVALIATVLALSVLIFFGIIIGFILLFVGTGTLFVSTPDQTAIWASFFGATFASALFAIFWTPAQTLVIAVLYLDLRVRKEALDLEWGAYSTASSAPAAPVSQSKNAPTPAGSPDSFHSQAERHVVPQFTTETPTPPEAPNDFTLTSSTRFQENGIASSGDSIASHPKDLRADVEAPVSTFGVPSFDVREAPHEEKA